MAEPWAFLLLWSERRRLLLLLLITCCLSRERQETQALLAALRVWIWYTQSGVHLCVVEKMQLM